VGKLKKVGIGIAVSLVLVFVVIPFFGMSVPAIEDRQALKQFLQMSDQELNTMAVDWNYRDLLRNTDDYTGKIIFVDGRVGSVDRGSDALWLCTSTNNPMFSDYTCQYNDFYVKLNGIDSWIEEDMLQGYVEVTGEFENYAYLEVKEIKLTCSNC
jgi:hypothetical protein